MSRRRPADPPRASTLRAAVFVACGLALGAPESLAHADPPATPDGTHSPAADPDARARALEQRLDDLDRRYRLLEQRLEMQAAQVPPAPPPSKPPVSVSATAGKGVTIALPDDRLSFNLRARVQLRDTVLHVPRIGDVAEKTTNELNIKTVRLWMTGNVLVKDLTYGVQLAFGGNDFEPGSSSPLFDAFVEYSRLRDLRVKAGQFFVPFDRLRTVREFALEMVDRPQPIAELTLDRDVGVQLHSQDLGGLGGRLNYSLGVFGGEGRNRFGGQAMGGLYVARIGVRPFGNFDDDTEGDLERDPRPRLAIGVAGAYNQGTNRTKSTYGPAFTSGTLDYAHAAADLILKVRGFYLAAEVVYRQGLTDFLVVPGKDAAAAPTKEWSRSGLGYVAQASMMVHGKVQIAARWSHLVVLPLSDPALVTFVAQQGHEAGAGLNFYLNGHALKLQADYHFLFGDSAVSGRHLARVQLDATF